MTIADSGRRWRKPSRSQNTSNCVELALDPARARVRDTKDRDGGTLDVPFSAWSAFTEQLRQA
ncbi:DUF397 domain-containing protein [Haloechinothrix sp. YIM 98757]|uniref:DUF397 domain-containing protein n=1 Tax=Haloechinothrix aidingensis TaxID=2752311 RepID=A0A838A5N9_9PSEU|nr:DUF397 domain-containing protein [Haloechinothrix aidingensis]MBA0125080.1 DUF397 domain-containing protein [Haloechinothrix aidingensis]